MDARSRRRPRRRASAAVIATLLCLGLAACQQAPDRLVAQPPDGAEPAHVVQAMVDAINAQDEAVVERVASDGFAQMLIEHWFGMYLTDAEIGDTLDHGETVDVLVAFTPENGDASMPNGQHVTWAALLERENGNWVVTDIGQG